MSIANSLLSLSGLVFRFLPTFIDSGVQIWNAVEIDEMVKTGDIDFPGPLEFVEQARRKRSTVESSSLFNIHLTDWLQFQVSVEGCVSLGLVQLPGFCLALFGMVKAILEDTSLK